MSFSRAKISRFNEKGRPSTAAIALKPCTSSQKSLIPKFRSLSQPPSTQSIKDGVRTNIVNIPLPTKAEEMDSVSKPKSVKSEEEFKDCLMQPEGGYEDKGKTNNSESKSELGSQSTMVNGEDFKAAKGSKSEKGSTLHLKMSRKNSSSGIPISVSGIHSKTTKPTAARASPRTPLTTPSRKPSSSSHLTNEKANVKKNFDLFVIKKKRYEQLRKEVLDKQKPILELYQTLQQLKKKLEEGGKTVTLESVKLVEYEDFGKGEKDGNNNKGKNTTPDLSAGGETLLRRVDLDPKVVNTMKNMIDEIPHGMMDLCKSLIDRRNEMLGLLERFAEVNSGDEHEELKEEIKRLRRGSDELDLKLQEAAVNNKEIVNILVEKWSELMDNNEMVTSGRVKELEGKLKKQEAEIMEMNVRLEKAKHELKEKTPADTAVFEDEIGKLKDKIMIMEKQIEMEKRKYQNEAEKFKKADLTLKTFKSKVKEFDSNKEHYDAKISQLSQDYRSAQLKIKQMEKNYEKEIADLNKSRHLDKSVIERLNKDKTTFESRLQTANEIQEQMRNEFEEKEIAMRKELQAAINEAEIKGNEASQLRKEIELLKKQINNLEVQTQQAADVMSRRNDHFETPETEKECELQVEIVAQRAAIRALQEKIEANAAEKLRFIETIEKMNGTHEDMNDTIVKSLVKKEEDITKYNLILKKNDELIKKQRMEIDSLNAKQENLLQQIESLQVDEDSNELKHMLKEGKGKLEQALMKSLENEHKIIKYEHELAQKNQTIGDLENMMKVRDGLIGVMKAKKDELTMENLSLTKYSEEIRSYVLESKAELKEKAELIHVYQTQLTTKERDLLKMEKKMHELEQKLSMTNEKRYKLQETICGMEKELQATKLQMNQIEDMQTRPRNKFLRSR